MSKRVIELLQGMDLFAELAEHELGEVARVLREQRFAEDDVIFSQGETGNALYIVLEGRVRIAAVDNLGAEHVLAFCGPGEFFGEMAVFTDSPRTSTATASTPARVLLLRKADFERLAQTNASITRGMLRLMVERQATLNTRVSQQGGGSGTSARGVISVVFSPRGGAGTTMLATNLAVALAERAPDRVVGVDLDLLFGHMPMLLDVVPRTALAAITPGAIRQLDRDGADYYLTRHADSTVRLLAGTLRPEESELVTGEHVRAKLELLRRHFAHVVVDAGTRFSEPALAALDLADEIIVVCSAEPAGSQALVETHRVVHQLLRCAPERTTYVVNHVLPYGKLDLGELARRLQTERVAEVPFGGEAVGRAALGGTPLVTAEPGNPASRAITRLARQLERAAAEALALGS